MPTAYPRLNRGQIRAKVRDLTNIEATLVVSDERINNLINEELHKLILIADELEQFWQIAGNPITVTQGDGITYRVPGWRFDNTSQFPGGLAGNIYLGADATLPPWNNTANGQYKAGYYDNYLVYAVSARVLAENADDTTRGAEFRAQAEIIGNTIIEQEFIGHNADAFVGIGPSTVGYDLRLYFKTLVLLKNPLRIEGNFVDVLSDVLDAVTNERNELYSAYSWPFVNTSFNDWAPYSDIFAYGAAARLAARFGMSEPEQKSLLADYETRKQALLREKLYNASGAIQPYTFAGLKAQVRALLQDYTKDLPETIIGQWINDAYQTLAYEREWRWLEQEVTVNVPAGSATIDLTFGSRILSMYEIKFDDNGNIKESGQIYPVGHGYDVLNNASDYRYSMDASFVDNMFMSDSVVTIFPTPKEPIVVGIRFAETPGPLTLNNSATLIGTQFASILAYRAAVVGAAFHPQAKQLIPAYEAQAQRIYDSMLRHYQLDTSTETFSIGENALETRKYLPFFRVG